MPDHRPPGVLVVCGLFGFGTLMSLLAALALLPNSPLQVIWTLNPTAHTELQRIGNWAIVLMLTVCVVSATAALGLWRGAAWGRRLAIVGLAVNLVSDIGNALLRGDYRTLIGVPIGGAIIVYLLSRRVRGYFAGGARPVP